MFAPDPKVLSRLAPTLQRTVIVDPNVASSRLMTDILKGMGAREIYVEGDESRALHLIRDVDPGLILTECAGPALDGPSLARKLRRSSMACRRAPIIMVTAEATAKTILGARDAGVHEFLRKPFTALDLFRRVENVALKARDWIEGVSYIGPDRRRFNSGEYAGPQKRKADKPATGAAAALAVKDQAMRILAAALAQFDSDPMQAVRAARQQAETLKELALKASDVRLVVAAAGLESALAKGALTKAALTAPINALLALAEPATTPVARAG